MLSVHSIYIPFMHIEDHNSTALSYVKQLFCYSHEKRNVLCICENKNAEHQRGNQAAQVCFEALNLSWVEPILSNEGEVSVFLCTICTRVRICTREQLYTREQINTRVHICTPLCRVHMPINCVHTHLDLIRNLTQGTHFRCV